MSNAHYKRDSFSDATPSRDDVLAQEVASGEFTDQRQVAIRYYAVRLLLFCLMQLIPQVILFVLQYWMSTVVGMVEIIVGLLAGYYRNSELVLVYLVLALLVIAKDIGILIGYEHRTFGICVIVFDLLFTPLGIYMGWYLRKCLHLYH